jgi:dihydrofolate synthase / folylpolyglutamate synthase
VGHNPGAAAAFSKSLEMRFPNQPKCFIVGIMKDKDIAGILNHYCKAASRLIFVKPNTDRAADCETLFHHVPTDFTGTCVLSADTGDAIAAALAGKETLVCIAGSFYTVGEAMAACEVEPYG